MIFQDISRQSQTFLNCLDNTTNTGVQKSETTNWNASNLHFYFILHLIQFNLL